MRFNFHTIPHSHFLISVFMPTPLFSPSASSSPAPSAASVAATASSAQRRSTSAPASTVETASPSPTAHAGRRPFLPVWQKRMCGASVSPLAHGLLSGVRSNLDLRLQRLHARCGRVPHEVPQESGEYPCSLLRPGIVTTRSQTGKLIMSCSQCWWVVSGTLTDPTNSV